MTWMRIPARWAPATASAYAGPGRVDHRDQAEQRQARPRRRAAVGRAGPSTGPSAGGRRRAPAARRRRTGPACCCSSLADGVVQRLAMPPCGRARVRSRAARSPARLWCARRSGPVRLPSSTRRHALEVGVEVEDGAAGRRRGRAGRRRPRDRRRGAAGPARWGRRCRRAGRRSAPAAVVQAAAAMASTRARGVVDRRRSASSSAPGSHSRVTRIRFSVSVPVLSVQMTVVEPRVSTAESRLTTAPLRASSRTPAASARVMVGSRPSGTLATIRPMEKLIAAAQPSPAQRPTGRNATPTATATAAMIQVDAADLRLQRAAFGCARAGTGRRCGRVRCACRCG